MAGAAGGGGYSASMQTSSDATGKQSGMFNDSGFVVNFKSSGNAAAATGAASPLPTWLLPALAVGAVLWMTTHKH